MNGIRALVTALNAKRSGSSYMARCPAHNDHNPSLALREAEDGRVLVHCHAGCSQAEVLAALQETGAWQSEQECSRPQIVATYDYTNEHGKLFYQVVRYQPKSFRQRQPDGRGGWIWKKHPHQVLYRLREVLEAPIVFVTEGEKDAETLRQYGFAATTNAGGAEAPWLPQFSEALCAREVILVPDADPPGRKRVLKIAQALLGKVARLIIWEPDGAKDITEWFALGHNELELIAQVEGEAVNQ